MLVRSHVHQEWELLKWLVLFVLASAFALAFASGIAGAADIRRADREPRPLPADITESSSPMANEPVESAWNGDLGMMLWQVLSEQHNEHYEEALAMWDDMIMPCETEVWKHVAMGQAYLATGEVERAAEALHEAGQLEPQNPVVHYLTGILRLEQAYLADEWYDAMGPAQTRFVSVRPPMIVPNTKSMYKLSALHEFEKAIASAPDVWFDQSLLPPGWPSQAALEPTVGDLLMAISADQFVANSHNSLSYLYLETGALAEAEHHMDEAAAAGLTIVYGYYDLAEEYEKLGEHGDAARAYLKATQHSPKKLDPAIKAWENLHRFWGQVW